MKGNPIQSIKASYQRLPNGSIFRKNDPVQVGGLFSRQNRRTTTEQQKAYEKEDDSASAAIPLTMQMAMM